jgi:hypothetical protein
MEKVWELPKRISISVPDFSVFTENGYPQAHLNLFLKECGERRKSRALERYSSMWRAQTRNWAEMMVPNRCLQ